jgi:hypothetical protein
MNRGAIIKLSADEMVDRALSACAVPKDRYERIWYCNTPGKNGGSRPAADHCASVWQDKHVTWKTADCVGFLAWCMGFDRYQPPTWWNQNFILRDARGPRKFWKLVESPAVGDVALVPDLPATATTRKRVGHVGLVTGKANTDWLVTHCSPSNHKRVEQGIATTALSHAFGRREVFFVKMVEGAWIPR